MHVLVINVTLA